MQTRLVQLIARYIAIVLLSLTGWIAGTAPTDAQTGQIESLSTVIGGAIVAILLLLGDLLIHRLRHGGVLKDKPNARLPMLLLCGALSVGVIATQPGCALFNPNATVDDALADYDRANEVYLAAVSFALDARLVGKISIDDWNTQILPLIERGDLLLDDFETAARLEDSAGVQRLGFLLNSVADQILIRARLPPARIEPGDIP